MLSSDSLRSSKSISVGAGTLSILGSGLTSGSALGAGAGAGCATGVGFTGSALGAGVGAGCATGVGFTGSALGAGAGAGCATGVGFTGSALDPYGLVSVYSKNDESLRYDKGTDTTTIPVDVVVEGLVEGKTNFTASMDAWTKLLEGKKVTITETGTTNTFEVKVDSENYAVKLPILAAVEKAVLEQYNMIPLLDDSSASLKGQKYNYYTEDYIYGVGRGGIKYRTYNYNDSEWASYVESKGGTLNYK